MASKNKTPKLTPESVVQHMPKEIIVNILTRTSVKSLSRFKCVSKSWLSMISSPQFIKSHLQFSSPNRNVILAYSCKSSMVTFYTCSLDHYLMNYKSLEPENLIKLTFEFDLGGESPRDLVLVGSSNGLCCIATMDKSLVLFNLSTRKWKQIPEPVFDGIDESHGMMYNTFGFAYDDSCDDYKIVHFQPWPNEKLVLRIYSLRTDSWSKIEADNDAPFHRQGRPSFVNGKLHWMVKPRGENYWIIMSYDLKTGSIGQLMHPCDGFRVGTFGVFKGHLCLEDGRDIWIMSEYGVDESWKKVASYCQNEREFRWDLDFLTIQMGSGGTLDSVFKYQQQYNKNTENYKKLEVAPYIETLVTLTFEGDTSLPVVQGKMDRVEKVKETRGKEETGAYLLCKPKHPEQLVVVNVKLTKPKQPETGECLLETGSSLLVLRITSCDEAFNFYVRFAIFIAFIESL